MVNFFTCLLTSTFHRRRVAAVNHLRMIQTCSICDLRSEGIFPPLLPLAFWVLLLPPLKPAFPIKHVEVGLGRLLFACAMNFIFNEALQRASNSVFTGIWSDSNNVANVVPFIGFTAGGPKVVAVCRFYSCRSQGSGCLRRFHSRGTEVVAICIRVASK